jgi:hypothetical protein
MKTQLSFLFSLLCLISSYAQTIRRVNNTPGVTGANVYTTVQAAHDAAAVGDIIYLEPSSTNSPNHLGPLVCTKRLTIIGTGYFLPENAGEPGMPADKREARVNTSQFNSGSAGSVIMGVVFTNNEPVSVRDANIKFERCYMYQINLGAQVAGATVVSSSNNTRIARCFFPSTTSNSGFYSINGQSWTINSITYYPNNCQIENCIVNGINSIRNSFFNNNIFTYNSFNGTDGLICKNNIFFSVFGLGPASNTFQNNVSTTNVLPAGNGNVNGVNSSLLFITGPSSTDKKFQLAPASPARSAGVDGIDCGIFGGDTPYILSGLPPYPVITDLQVSGTGSTAIPLNVIISAKSNN